MDLSIVILNYNSKDYLLPALLGIAENTSDLAYEVIIVDNHSTDSSADYIRSKILPRFENARLMVATSNRGYAAGNNLGIREARGKYVAIMNPDIVIWDNALQKILQFMEENPRLGLAGPKLVLPDGGLQYFCYRFPRPAVLIYRRTPLGRLKAGQRAITEYLMTDWDHDDSRPVDWLQGSFLVARRSALAEIGLMDERFFLFLEDTDWCRRFWLSGWQVWYYAGSEVVHYHNRASDTGKFYKSLFNKMTWIHLFSAWRYFRKWGVR